MQHADSFRAMDTAIDAFVESDGPRPLDLFISLRLLFEEQEQRFSRFRPASLLSALNDGATIDDARFVRACRLALEANEITGGLYNPMVLPALREAGYRGTFATVDGGAPRAQAVPDPRDCLAFGQDGVALRAGALDLGGIVKGWTVDLGIELMRSRCPDVFLNAGGDLRCEGAETGADGWLVAVAAPDNGPDPWEGVMRGALATSTTAKRRWSAADGSIAHHLIDPRTGLPADSRYVQASVWAPETWLAEVWAKAVLIGGEPTLRACQTAGHKVLAIP